MAFATTDDFAVLVNRALSGAEAAQVQLLLDLATSAIKGWTHQQIEAVTGDVAKLAGTWQPVLELPERPVTAVSAVKVNGLALSSGVWQWNEQQLLRAGGPCIGLDCVLPAINWSTSAVSAWGGPVSTVEVTYSHGYAVIPDDIRVACLSIAMRYQVIYATGADLSAGFVLSDNDKALLRRYRRWWN